MFEEVVPPGQLKPSIWLRQLDGACAFLEDDNLCLIHRVLGFEAKPAACQFFPLRVTSTPDATLIGVTYACRGTVRNLGEPLSQRWDFLLRLLERCEPSLREFGRLQDTSEVPCEPVLAGDTRLDWTGYQALERSLLGLLARRGFPVACRLAASMALIDLACDRWRRPGIIPSEEIGAWLEEQVGQDRADAFLAAAGLPKVEPERQRSLLAPLIAEMETPYEEGPARGSAVLHHTVSILREEGDLPLGPGGGRVPLAAMRGVVFDQDSPAFEDLLARTLSNYLLRKTPLQAPSLRDGCRYLAVYFALLRWYCVAQAALAGRSEVEEADLVEAIRRVDRRYPIYLKHWTRPEGGLLGVLLRLELDSLLPPVALLSNPYALRRRAPLPSRPMPAPR